MTYLAIAIFAFFCGAFIVRCTNPEKCTACGRKAIVQADISAMNDPFLCTNCQDELL